MKGGAARPETLSLGIVIPDNVAHEFSHAVAVIVRRLESVFSD